jgi:hypothetical protein
LQVPKIGDARCYAIDGSRRIIGTNEAATAVAAAFRSCCSGPSAMPTTFAAGRSLAVPPLLQTMAK